MGVGSRVELGLGRGWERREAERVRETKRQREERRGVGVGCDGGWVGEGREERGRGSEMRERSREKR